MSLRDDVLAKVTADREAGRDVPPVIEELFLLLADHLDPQPKPEPEQPAEPQQ